jgi:hypothetical protein
VHFEHESYDERLSWTDRILTLLLQIRSFHLEEVVIRVSKKVACWTQFSRLRKVPSFIPTCEFASGPDYNVREQMAICEARRAPCDVMPKWIDAREG